MTGIEEAALLASLAGSAAGTAGAASAAGAGAGALGAGALGTGALGAAGGGALGAAGSAPLLASLGGGTGAVLSDLPITFGGAIPLGGAAPQIGLGSLGSGVGGGAAEQAALTLGTPGVIGPGASSGLGFSFPEVLKPKTFQDYLGLANLGGGVLKGLGQRPQAPQVGPLPTPSSFPFPTGLGAALQRFVIPAGGGGRRMSPEALRMFLTQLGG